MKAKKWLTLLLSGAMALSVGVMAACGNNNDKKEDKKDPPIGGGSYTVDETEYYIVGGGEGSVKQNGWSNTNHVLTMKRDESADHNVFSITLDIYADDAFQIIHDDSWDGQMGIDYFLDVEEDDDLGSVVKNEDGDVVFYGSGMFNTDITLQKGQDGVYTISLHTFPGSDTNPYITYTKDSELSALLDMYVVSDMNDFGFRQAQYEASHMEKTSNGWKSVVTIEESDLVRDAEGNKSTTDAQYVAIAVRNDVADETGYQAVTCDDTRTPVTFIDGDKYNLLPAGIYTFMYNPETDTLTIVDGAFELYFVGSFNGWADGATEEWKLTEGSDGNWTGYLKLDEPAEAKLHNPLANGWYSPDGNNIQLDAGEYFFKFTTAEEKVEYEKMAYYVVGSYTNAAGEADDNYNFKLTPDTSVKLDAADDGVASGVVEFSDVSSAYDWVKPGVFAFKVVYGTYLGGARDWHGDGDDNVLVPAAGEYTVSIDVETKEVTLVPVVHEKKVTFDLNYEGATGAPEAQIVNEGEKATAPTAPTRKDYTFYGWYLDKECTEKYDFDSVIEDDITLYARWVLTSSIPASVKVTFDLNYESAAAATQVDTVNGLVAQPADPEREGYYFLGWYDAATDGELVDFDALVNTAKTVYAHWNYVYHIVGSLNNGEIGNWDTADYSLALELDPANPTGNYYKISGLLLFAGDQFKIVGPNNWNDGYAAGAGCLRGDDTQLAGGDNIEVKVNGIYTLYLKVEGAWEITWEVEPLAATNDLYFVVNGEEGAKLNEKDGDFLGSVTVKAGDVVKLVDKYDNNKEYAVNITEAGDYMVKFVAEDSSVVVEKLTFYIAGTLFGSDGKAINFSIVEESPKLVLGQDGKYTVEIVVTDVTGTSDYGWMKEQNQPGIFGFQVVYGSVLGGVKDWHNVAAESDLYAVNGNVYVKAAGTYIVTYDPVEGIISLSVKA